MRTTSLPLFLLTAATLAWLSPLRADVPVVTPDEPPKIVVIPAPSGPVAYPPPVNGSMSGGPRRLKLDRVVRNLMLQVGFPDERLQSVIASHMTNENRGREPLRIVGQELSVALQTPGVTQTEMKALLQRYQQALDNDRMRRLKAEARLDQLIGYTKNPRLESVLLLFGIIGDGALFVPRREVPQVSSPEATPSPATPLEAMPNNPYPNGLPTLTTERDQPTKYPMFPMIERYRRRD